MRLPYLGVHVPLAIVHGTYGAKVLGEGADHRGDDFPAISIDKFQYRNPVPAWEIVSQR